MLRSIPASAVLLPLLAAGAAACFSPARSAPAKNIVETAQSAGGFETLVAAVGAAGLAETLSGPGPFTVFAPTDAAFAALPEGTVERLLRPENKSELVAVLTYHVVPGKVLAEDVVELSGAVTVQGQRLDIVAGDDGVRVDGANVTSTDIDCSNGVIHVIDAVLLPAKGDLVATATNAGTFVTLLAAAKAAGLAETLTKDGPFTIFAPTDAAFRALPAGTVDSLLRPENREQLVRILKNHLVEGRVYSEEVVRGQALTTLAGTRLRATVDERGARIGDARISATDIDASNGVVHVIDSVLLPD